MLSKQFAQQMKMHLLSKIFISESNVLHNDKVSTWVICLDAADVKKKKKKEKEGIKVLFGSRVRQTCQ